MDKIAFSGNNDQQAKFLKVAINDGRCTATQVRLTLLYQSATITSFTIPFIMKIYSGTAKSSDIFNGIIHTEG